MHLIPMAGRIAQPMLLASFLIPFAGLGFLAVRAPMATAEEERPVVILLGDSIRIGYQRVVLTELAGKANVWTPKANCKHTQFTLEHIEEWVKGRKPAVVHINCGLHDLFLNKATDKPRHSLDVYAENLRTIFKKLRKLTDAEIIFALTTAVDEERQATSKTYGRVVRRNVHIAAYNAKAREIAGEFNVRVNDLYAVVQEGGVDVMLIDDGIHLSPEGARRVGKQVARSILAVLGENVAR